MRKIISITLLILLVCGVCYAENKEAKWQYVVTRNDVSYSVDVNSIKLVSNTIVFWMIMDNNNENKIGMIDTAINPYSREFRFEEGYFYEKQTKKQLSHNTNPDQWKPIGKGSPIELIVDYVIKNHPDTKDIHPKS